MQCVGMCEGSLDPSVETISSGPDRVLSCHRSKLGIFNEDGPLGKRYIFTSSYLKSSVGQTVAGPGSNSPLPVQRVTYYLEGKGRFVRLCLSRIFTTLTSRLSGTTIKMDGQSLQRFPIHRDRMIYPILKIFPLFFPICPGLVT